MGKSGNSDRWKQVDDASNIRFSISKAKIKHWITNNKSTLTMRFHGPGEEDKFADDLMTILEEINATSVN